MSIHFWAQRRSPTRRTSVQAAVASLAGWSFRRICANAMVQLSPSPNSTPAQATNMKTRNIAFAHTNKVTGICVTFRPARQRAINPMISLNVQHKRESAHPGFYQFTRAP